MKANRTLAILLTSALAACSGPAIVPTPAPQPAPAPRPAPPAPPPVKDWRDAPATPGDWTWGMEGGRSTARFAGGQLALTCNRANGTVLLYRQGAPAGSAGSGLTIQTQTTTRSVAGTAAMLGGTQGIAANLAANNSLLDAIAFSRGRFAVQAAGLPTLYVPSWPEISRVIEDCR